MEKYIQSASGLEVLVGQLVLCSCWVGTYFIFFTLTKRLHRYPAPPLRRFLSFLVSMQEKWLSLKFWVLHYPASLLYLTLLWHLLINIGSHFKKEAATSLKTECEWWLPDLTAVFSISCWASSTEMLCGSLSVMLLKRDHNTFLCTSCRISSHAGACVLFLTETCCFH